jgi:dTDP-4-dehydrorhamnose reductase
MRGRVAVTGASGQLGGELVRAFRHTAAEVLPLGRSELDVTRPADIERLVELRPELVVHAAAWTDVDGAARDPERAMRINGEGAGAVAAAAARVDAPVVQISSNEVFAGSLERPYAEEDAPQPINPYGASKLAGERLVAAATARHLIVRTAWLFGASQRSFPEKIRAAAQRALDEGRTLRVVEDEWGNPTDVRWLAPAIVQLVELALAGAAAWGTYHLAGMPPTSRAGWARQILAELPVAIEPIRLVDYPRDSQVPPHAVLDVSRATALGIAPGTWF